MENNVVVRAATSTDNNQISRIHIENFHHDLEVKLIIDLEKLESFKPYYSEVITLNDVVIGHALVTPVKITNSDNETDALVLGPVSIDNNYQRKGYGKLLLNRFFEILKENGHNIILVYGGDYYKQFGFEKANYVFRPNPVYGHGILVKRLDNQPSDSLRGVIHYPAPFNPLINEWSK